MPSSTISRRRALQALGLSGAALPLMPSLFARTASAATGPCPKRFIALFSANGSRFQKYFPNDSELGELPWVVRDQAHHVREVPLSQVPGDRISAVFGPEFNGLRDKINIIRGLDLIRKGGGHNPHFMLSGWAGLPDGSPDLHETIDQIMARSSTVYPQAPHKRSIHLQVKGPQGYGGPLSVQEAAGQISQVPRQIDPVAAYASIFGGLPEPDDPGLDLAASRRASLLRSLQDDYLALRDNRRIGADDKQRLDAHVTLLDDLARRLAATPAEGCTFPDAPVALDQGQEVNLPQVTRDHMDLIVATIKCDLSRVAAFQLCSGTDTRTFSFLGDEIAEDHHRISHDYSYPGGHSLSAHKMGLIGHWYATQVAYLLEQLDVVEDPATGATYLDNSVVYWGNEFGTNGWHGAIGMPVMLAGSGGGYLRTGLHMDYREIGQPVLYDYQGSTAELGGDTDFRGRPYNDLLVTLLRAMDLQPEDWEHDGEPGIGDYRNNYLGQYDEGDRRSPLPYLTAV